MNTKRFFPMFFDISQTRILIVGAGTIATRRIEALLEFARSLEVVAVEATSSIYEWEEQGHLLLKQRKFVWEDLQDKELVLAITDDAALNGRIGQECKKRGILVNVASDKSLCDFHFPGLVLEDEIVIGINAGGQNHRKAKAIKAKIKAALSKE
ncbi:MAG: bifunctional precorrin-2 dehydrogenase/sirohydrochlorin ferrochelatase [Lachnospiraceae bacterium]